MIRLKECRSAKNWTQAELGKKIGVSRTAITKYETGDRQLEPATICLLCDLFGCTADYLLGRSDAPLPVISGEDAELLAAYHALPLAIRQAVDGLLAPYRPASGEKAAGSS